MFLIGVENQLGYGVTLLVGGLLALGLCWIRCEKVKIRRGKILAATILLPLITAFFAHLLYCLVNFQDTAEDQSVGYFFAFWENGSMFYGGVLGAVTGLLVLGGKDRLAMLEQYAPGGALIIAAARIGEGFLGQGYGDYATGLPLFNFFPFRLYDPYYDEWAQALFVLEALIALALFVWLLKKKTGRPGDGALLLLGLYASAQIVLESLRRDEFLRWGFVRTEEVASAAAVLIVLICYAVWVGGGKRLIKALCFGTYMLMIVLCLLLEFATEGRIPFLEFLSVDACYLVMAGACAVLGGCVLWMRRLANTRYSAERVM